MQTLRGAVLVCVAVALASAAAAPVGAAARAAHCPGYGVRCLRVEVPLDWSGTRPGRVSLNVQVLAARGRPRGTMILLSGGPGQAATQLFDLYSGDFWQQLLPGYTLVAFDTRGTGGSGPITCPAVDVSAAQATGYGAACARRLGADRAFYSTAANVRDLDAVRGALGVERVGLFAVSYGTDLALAYARAFPDRVSRLLLDSVATPLNAITVVDGVVRQLPATLRAYCLGRCGGVTTDYGGDVVALAHTLAARPLLGAVLEPDGSRRPERLTATAFLDLVLQTDLDPGLAAELPAAVHAARDGEPGPLLQLAALLRPSYQIVKASATATAVYTATVCNDGPFPWPPGTPPAERPALLARALATVPARALGGFGAWAQAIGDADLCLDWPLPATPAAAPPSGPPPDIPVLAVAGQFDLRATTAQARAAVAAFPHGHLLVVANVGHSAITIAESPCLDRAIRRWLAGDPVPAACTATRPLAPLAAFPPLVATAPAAPAQTLSLVAETLEESACIWLLTQYENTPGTVGGLEAGALRASSDGYTLRNYAIAGGVELDGTLLLREASGAALSFRGTVRVSERGATIGTLGDLGGRLAGSLDGRLVVAGRITAMPAVPVRSSPALRGWAAFSLPGGPPALVARAIATRVGDAYRVSAGGPALVTITAGAPAVREGSHLVAVSAVALRTRPNSNAGISILDTTTTWSYAFCGAGPDCAVGAGAPTARSGRLVRREALEVALVTFEYVPAITAVLVELPAGSASAAATTLFVRRSELAAALAVPLDRTLSLATPPLPTAPDPAEAAAIDRLTLPHLYTSQTVQLDDGTAALVLTPAAAPPPPSSIKQSAAPTTP